MKRAWSRKNLWDALPAQVKRCFGVGLSAVPPSLMLGRRFRHALRFAEEAQWWSFEKAQEHQLRRVREVCNLAYHCAPYYRTLFDSIGLHPSELKTLDDLRLLPLMDKDTVREHMSDILTVPPDSRAIDYISTGGTSGSTLQFYADKSRSAVEYAYLVSSWQRAGFQLGMTVAVIRGRVVSGKQRHEYDPLLRHHYYSNFHMSDEQIAEYCGHIRGIGECLLHTYPSSAALLAEFCARRGVSFPDNIVAILLESEMVYPEQRAMLHDVTQARIFSSYGHSEKLVAAAECEFSTNYHVWPTYGYCELIDPDGQAVTIPGVMGEIVGTGFINMAMPFIRYRTGDYAVYAGRGCRACGRDHLLLDRIEGRWPRGALVARDGSLISMTALNLHDQTFEGVRQYQFVQEEAGHATLRVVAARPLNREDLDRIIRGLRPKLQDRIEVTVQLVDEIALTERGKFKLVDQRIPGVHQLALIGSSGR